MPLFARKFIVDAVETGVAALLALSVVGDREAFANAVLVAVGSAVLSAARRNAPGFYAWVRDSLGVAEE